MKLADVPDGQVVVRTDLGRRGQVLAHEAEKVLVLASREKEVAWGGRLVRYTEVRGEAWLDTTAVELTGQLALHLS